MKIKDISLPEVYKESMDFRFFMKWFEDCLNKIKFDTENMIDIYDPLRCPENILWMLADTMGYKYDDRLPASFNRLVLVYFMSMIRLKGSKDGITLAAETNLAQFRIRMLSVTGYEDENGEFVEPKDILGNRLEDTTIPANSVYVTPHTDKGYIDVVYFSTEIPVDACIEYVRPLGMYLFQHAGVKFDAKVKVSVDARLTNSNYKDISIGATHVGHYRRDDYARMHRGDKDKRNDVWYRNSKYEGEPNPKLNPGERALYSLQLSNNEQIVKSLIDPIFSIGKGPEKVEVTYPDDYLMKPDNPRWNLRYDRKLDESITKDTWTVDDRTKNILNPRPAVNPIMHNVGDAMSLNEENTKYTKLDKDGNITIVDSDSIEEK